MKQKAKSKISFFLALIMLLGIFPMTALAADDERVLTSMDHSSAVAAVNIAGENTATLMVPYAYTGTVDLSNGLDISYNTSIYKSAVVSFPFGSEATVGGPSVSMTVTYQTKNDDTLYETHYSINVVRASGTAPSFTGTISKTVALPDILTFTKADFTGKYIKNDGGSLASIAIIGNNPSFGSLKLGTARYGSGEIISISDLEAGKLTFTATGAGTASYVVKAYASGDTETRIGSVDLTITASENNDIATIAYSTAKNTPVVFNSKDFIDAFSDATDDTLSYVEFTLPSSAYGKLYFNYNSSSDFSDTISSDIEYSSQVLSHITFVPYTDYSGIVTIPYTGCNSGDEAFEGEIKISIDKNTDDSDGSDHFTDVGKNLSWAADAIDYLYEHDIITGEKSGYYNPNASISRGDFVLMLCRAFDLKTDKKGSFSDISEDSYYYDAIGTAKTLGIGKGANGKFNPKSALSRQDAMVLILRALKAADISIDAGDSSDLDSFTDSGKISDYAVDAFAALAKADIIQGFGKKLNPKSSISRAEIAVILYRILENIEELD